MTAKTLCSTCGGCEPTCPDRHLHFAAVGANNFVAPAPMSATLDPTIPPCAVAANCYSRHGLAAIHEDSKGSRCIGCARVVTPAAGTPPREPQGTFACPLCGIGTPHGHEAWDVERHQLGGKCPGCARGSKPHETRYGRFHRYYGELRPCITPDVPDSGHEPLESDFPNGGGFTNEDAAKLGYALRNVRVTQNSVGTTPVLKCEECGYLTFDLNRLAEIHACQRAGVLRLTSVEGLPVGAPDVRRAVLNNPLCAAVAAHARQEMHADLESLRASLEASQRENAEMQRLVREYVTNENAIAADPHFMEEGWGDRCTRRDETFAALRSSLSETPHAE